MYLYLIIYLLAISLLAVILTVYDKNAALKNAWRVKERTLLAVCFLGGAFAMLLTMLCIRHKTRHIKFMLGIPLIILLQIAFFVTALNQSLSISHFSVKTAKIEGQIKLALVADLHSCYYGDEQSGLLKALEAEQPDAILMCGDIFDDHLPPANTITFIEGVSAKYLCYYVSGNHEFWSGQADGFKDLLISYGVKVLEGEADIIGVRGDTIKICGLDDPDTDRYTSRALLYAEQKRLLSASTTRDIFTVLLSHRPERIKELLPQNPDLVLSGHAHGGQWRIPYLFENGLFSPNQGLFPTYTNGEYSFGATILIVSRGLARESIPIPRVFNRPEIVIITLEGSR